MLRFGHIVIASKDPAATSKFMSFLFDDVPFFNKPNDIRFLVDGVEFRILLDKDRAGEDHEFIFVVDDRSALSELKNKIEFFCYTNHLSLVAPELRENCLSFKDQYGSLWKFETSCEKIMHLVNNKLPDVSFR